jgi:cardiolipin synthase
VEEIRADFDRVFPQCREVTEKYRSGLTVPMRVAQLLLRIVSPLL